MSFSTGFRGTTNGAVQSNYTDQPGVGVPGMQAYAGDHGLVDSYLVNETDGVAAGRGVVFTTISDSISLQRPNRSVGLPTVATTAADFAGINLFDEAMQSDANGVPGWAYGRMARIQRPSRMGGRVYVKAVEAIDPDTDTVNMVTVAPADESYAVGEFSPSALGGGNAGTSVELTNCKWETVAAAGGVAIIELLGDTIAVGS